MPRDTSGRPPRKPGGDRPRAPKGRNPAGKPASATGFRRRRPPADDSAQVDVTNPNQRLPRPPKPDAKRATKTPGKRATNRPPAAEGRSGDTRRDRSGPQGGRPSGKTFARTSDRNTRSGDDKPRGRPASNGERNSERHATGPQRHRDRPRDGDKPVYRGKPRRDDKPQRDDTPRRDEQHKGRASSSVRHRSKEQPHKPKHRKEPPLTGPDGLAARNAAAYLVGEVLANHRPLDDALADAMQTPALARLSRADRGFARAIAATTLRRLGQIEDALARFLEKGLPEKSGPLHDILATAAAQLLFLDSAPHAVINLAVQQVKNDSASQRYDKLTNAVLRRLSEQTTEILAAQDAVRLNTPDWLWNAWTAAYGEETARQIGEAHLAPALLDLSVRDDPAAWAEKTGATLLPTGTLRLKHKGRIENIAGFDEGAWWVQDAAAALPAHLLGDIKGKRVADLAAAPGGKTAQLAAAGAKVTAVDGSAGRLERLAENMERLHLEAEIVKADILSWRPKAKFDAVLLDAPCTATGTIRRHPDLPYLKRADDIVELAAIQAAMLDQAASFLKPGGTLVYCTCSLQPEEGPKQIDALLQRNNKLALQPVTADELAGRTDWITPEGYLRTLPFHAPGADLPPGMDGFFAARLRRQDRGDE